MKLESIRLKNFRAFQNATLACVPDFCVVVGANGTGKSTLFNVFEFLKNAMAGNVNSALIQLGGNRGFQEVRSRNSTGPIEIEIKFRKDEKSPLATYFLQINEENGKAFVEHESLKYRRGSHGKPWNFLDFSRGKGEAVTNESFILDNSSLQEANLDRSTQELKANDILAIKGLGQFSNFPIISALGNMIENWYIADFRVDKAKKEQDAGFAEHLNREGDNLSQVLQFLQNNHESILKSILKKLSERIPGVSDVQTKLTEEGRLLLKFKNGAFDDPFLARNVSDGTIKMLTYLVLLNDPAPHPMICVEEPENQLYPSILESLAEEFRAYSKNRNGGQVFVSTHSPDFLNAARLHEVFWLIKDKNGYTKVRRAADDPQIRAYVEDGDLMGYLWKQGFFSEVDPA